MSKKIAAVYPNGLPRMVRVGPIEYQVLMVENLTTINPAGDEIPLFGMVNFRRSEISIDTNLTPMMQWQCFWHELVHVILEQLGFEENSNEGYVDALAYKLMAVMVDNSFLKFPAPETSAAAAYGSKVKAKK